MIEHIDDILSSDLLERYVLGDVTDKERMKVDLLRMEYRPIRKKLEELEMTMEKLAMDNAIKAPAPTRECIIKSIGQHVQRPVTSTASNPIKSSVPVFGSWWKIAASFLIGSLGMWLFMKQQLNEQDLTLRQQTEELATLTQECEALNQQYAFLSDSNTLPFVLSGTALASESQVVVYWNEFQEKSLMRVVELPSIREDQTYQLWADVDGKMLSLGTFDAGLAVKDAIPMGYLADATSLNITVEPKGGSEHPTVSTLTASVTI